MLTRTLQGIPFVVVSPSYYRLHPELARDHIVDVSYLGSPTIAAQTPNCWCVHYGWPDGRHISRLFSSRDAAIAVIATAFHNARSGS